VRYKGRPIDSLKLPGGEWTYSREMDEIGIMKEWGRLPSEALTISRVDLTKMIAYEHMQRLMKAVENHEMEQRFEEERRRREQGK